MLVFENSFIRMDYDPVSDILSAEMPDVDSVVLPEIQRLLSIIVEQVTDYDVRRLLIDARKTQVKVDEETYTALITEFMRGLVSKTHLQKIARIVSDSTLRERVVRKVSDDGKLPIQLQSFTDIQSATEWLKQ